MTPQVKINNRLLATFVIMLMLASCHNYYKVNQLPTSKAATIDSLMHSERHFILHNGSASFHMKNVVLSAGQKTMACILGTVSFYHQMYLANGPNGKMKYKKNDPVQSAVLNEVHVHIPLYYPAVAGPYKIQLSQIKNIEVIEKDKKRTADSYIIGAIFYTIGVIFLFWIIGSVVFVSVMSAL